PQHGKLGGSISALAFPALAVALGLDGDEEALVRRLWAIRIGADGSGDGSTAGGAFEVRALAGEFVAVGGAGGAGGLDDLGEELVAFDAQGRPQGPVLSERGKHGDDLGVGKIQSGSRVSHRGAAGQILDEGGQIAADVVVVALPGGAPGAVGEPEGAVIVVAGDEQAIVGRSAGGDLVDLGERLNDQIAGDAGTFAEDDDVGLALLLDVDERLSDGDGVYG